MLMDGGITTFLVIEIVSALQDITILLLIHVNFVLI